MYKKKTQNLKPTRRYAKRNYKPQLTNRELYKLKQQVKNEEVKWYDAEFGTGSIPTTGSITDVKTYSIRQGDGSSNRDGRQIVLKKIQMVATVTLPDDTASNYVSTDEVRVMLVQDKQCNGAQATIADVLCTADIDSFNCMANARRFRVLYNKRIVVNSQIFTIPSAGTPTMESASKRLQKYIQCNIPITYDASVDAITDLTSNHLFFIFISRNGAINVNMSYRLRYVD